MLKDIVTLELQGANFTSPTVFKIFEPTDGAKAVKATLLYGRNGTGKSTIAKAFRKIRGEEISSIDLASIYDNDGNVIVLTEEEKKQIFVFDEDFIDENVKLQEDHLDTIVMLGEAADLTEKIKKAELKCNEAKLAFDKQNSKYKEYLDENNPLSPQYYITKMKDALRGDDCWAGRDKLIKGNRQNTQVNNDTYKQFLGLNPEKSKSELIVDFKDQLKLLENAKTGATTINTAVPSLSNTYIEYNDSGLKELLERIIEKPEFTDREKRLFKLIEDGKSADLTERINVLKQETTDTCPYCFQTISPEYKTDLIASIEKVLNKIVKEHQEYLSHMKTEEITMDLSMYSSLPSYEGCVNLVKKVNEMVLSNNELINSKIANPYSPIDSDETTVAKLSIKLRNTLEKLEKEREVHNSKVTKVSPIKKTLTRINGEIAHYDVLELSKQYDEQSSKFTTIKEENDNLKANWEKSEEIVKSLEAQRSNVKLALDSINSCMNYIFFSKDRLKIVYTDGAYKLLSYGNSVKPCDVSVGERNIIALSYFFTKMMEGKDENDVYNQEYIMVIDDPVSSYDAENRIGILSFLKYKLGEYLEGNASTKAFVMTHDLITFYDLYKVFEEIINACKSKGFAKQPVFNRFELSNCTISTFNYKHRQEYTELMEIVYRYARNETKTDEIIIGNVMRQVLEAFSTFQYKKNIEHVSTDPRILDLLKEPEYISYFKNLMYRLVLHGGSHREEQVKSMNDLSFFSLITDSEKRRTAKDILCFIYLLDKQHLLVHLANCKDVETTLDSWCQDIKDNAAII